VLNELETQLLMYDTTSEGISGSLLVVRALAAISDVDTRQILESRWTNRCGDKPPRARRARAMQEKIYETLRNPARAPRGRHALVPYKHRDPSKKAQIHNVSP
jgi:hypothetical protein